jgi:hypothetical protein
MKKDIVSIGCSRASMVSKHWLQHIIQTHMALDKTHLLLGDNYNVKKINELEQHIQDNPKDIYFAWMPPSIPFGRKDVLSIVVCREKNDVMVVKQVIPSPYWTSDQISSIELKYALESRYTLDTDYLYEIDTRMKLEWCIWELDFL